MSIKAKWRVEWWESERGWGQKPDYDQDFDTKEEALQAIKDHWDNEKKNNPSNVIPEWYIFPSPNSPYLVEVLEEAITESLPVNVIAEQDSLEHYKRMLAGVE